MKIRNKKGDINWMLIMMIVAIVALVIIIIIIARNSKKAASGISSNAQCDMLSGKPKECPCTDYLTRSAYDDKCVLVSGTGGSGSGSGKAQGLDYRSNDVEDAAAKDAQDDDYCKGFSGDDITTPKHVRSALIAEIAKNIQDCFNSNNCNNIDAPVTWRGAAITCEEVAALVTPKNIINCDNFDPKSFAAYSAGDKDGVGKYCPMYSSGICICNEGTANSAVFVDAGCNGYCTR